MKSKKQFIIKLIKMRIEDEGKQIEKRLCGGVI